MTDGAETLNQFLAHVDPEPEVVLTKIKLLFPDAFAQMEREGVLQYLDDPNKLRAYIGEFIKIHREAQLPEQVEPRASEVSPAEVAKRVEDYENARRETDQAINNRQGRLQELRDTYAKRLVDNLIEQTKASLEREKIASQQVASQIENARRQARAIPDHIQESEVNAYIRRVEEALPDYPEKSAVRAQAEADAAEINAQYTEAAERYTKAKESVFEAKKRLFASENPTTKPGVLLSRAIELSESGDYSTPDIAQMAELQARAVEFQEANISGVTMGGHGFFQTIADPKNAKEVNLAPLADRVFDTLRPEQKVAVIREVIERSLERFEKVEPAMSNTIRLAVRAGDAKSGTLVAARVGGFNGGLFRSFGGIPPQTLQLVGQSKTLEWLNTQSFYAFLMVDKLKTSLGGAGRFVLKEGAEALAKKAAGKTIGGAIGAWLSSAIPIPGIQLVGYFVGDVVIGKILEWGGAALSAAGRVLSGSVFTSILQGKPASWIDTFFLLPVILIILIPLLFIFPWVLNIPQFADDVRRTALVTSVGGGGEGFAPPFFQGEPAINSDITACPTSPGYTLTQCPAGDFSHDRLDAYDISIPMNQPIFSTHAGIVSFAGFSPSGYGNLVIVKGKTPDGKEYSTYYGHLAAILVSPGQQVTAGTKIGLADSTGNSTGSHLHYEYREGDSAAPNHGVRFLLPGCGYVNPLGCQL